MQSGSVTLSFDLPAVPTFLAIGDCAKALRVTYRTMWSILKSENGPDYFYVGERRCIRVPYESFISWLNNQKKL